MSDNHSAAGAAKNTQDVLAQCQNILAQEPYNLAALHRLAEIYRETSQDEESLKIYTKLAVAEPNNLNKANYHYYRALSLSKEDALDESLREYLAAIRYNPQDARFFDGLWKLAILYGNYMFFDSAQLCLDEISKHHRLAIFQWYKLLHLHHNPKIDAQTLFEEHRKWGRLKEETCQTAVHLPEKRKAHAKLRIGYVSPDFCRHPVASFADAVFKNHDKAQFDIYLYANVKKPDDITEHFQAAGHIWRDITKMSETDLGSLILADEIDILVDLAGHTSYSNIDVFAYKPAPVTVSWLGYPNTTGLSRIDYFLTDHYADPAGITDKYYTEELYRLPNSFFCYTPLQPAEIKPLPPICKNGCLTFGNFSSTLKKITPESIALWSLVLREVENSCFMLRSSSLSKDFVRERVTELFTNNGVDPERIILREAVPYQEYLQSYNDIDILLAPVRYCGLTGSCDALWMGVPVITLAGDMHVSRATASVLINLGLSSLAAATKLQYLAAAKRLAADIPLLTELKQSLRQRMSVSPVMDGALLTKNLENAYRDMWKRWKEGV